MALSFASSSETHAHVGGTGRRRFDAVDVE
jgi:hypothetical protein